MTKSKEQNELDGLVEMMLGQMEEIARELVHLDYGKKVIKRLKSLAAEFEKEERELGL